MVYYFCCQPEKFFGNNCKLSREIQFQKTVYLDAKKDITKNISFYYHVKVQTLMSFMVSFKNAYKKTTKYNICPEFAFRYV